MSETSAPSPEIHVGATPRPRPDPSALLAALDEAQRVDLENQARRVALAADMAKYRWVIAKDHHLLKDGRSKLNLISHPFQEEIIRSTGIDRVVHGSAQWGKSELLIIEMVAAAACGLDVLLVISKNDKRNLFVADRLDPSFGTVNLYKQMMSLAGERHAKSDNTQLKHFGPGSIKIIISTADRDFTSVDAAFCIVDEHQECVMQNLKKLDDRMSGSPWRYMLRVGHPTIEGTEENGNLDWLYQHSDRRLWHVPCPTCKLEQVIRWESHVVHRQLNKQGGIVAIRPRDQEWSPGKKVDMRPVCVECHRPMNRLSRDARWIKTKPGPEREGWRLSNLYNPNKRLVELYERYAAARHKPMDMQELYNKQFGEPFSMAGTRLTEDLLAGCATGEGGVPPYRFVPCSQFDWKSLIREERVA